LPSATLPISKAGIRDDGFSGGKRDSAPPRHPMNPIVGEKDILRRPIEQVGQVEFPKRVW